MTLRERALNLTGTIYGLTNVIQKPCISAQVCSQFYTTQYRHFEMKLTDSPNCTKCNHNTVLHTFMFSVNVLLYLIFGLKKLNILEFPIHKKPTLIIFNVTQSSVIAPG